MFGMYRTLLALCVVFGHLAQIEVIGAYAVFGFYTLSGYLMTLILHENYGYTPVGLFKYLINRFLRIFPPYWFSILLSGGVIVLLGENITTAYHEKMFIPNDIHSVLRHISLIFSHYSKPILTPPAWALTVEIFFYLLMAIGLSRTKRITLVAFILGVAYSVLVNVMALPWSLKYFVLPAALMPFATGGLIFHFKKEILTLAKVLDAPYAPCILLVLLAVNYSLFIDSPQKRLSGFYINFVLNAMLITSLACRRNIPFFFKRLDKWMGDLSYPIYLLHFQTGLILIAIGITSHRGDMIFALASLPVILLFSVLLTLVVERPIDLLRKRVKQK